MNKMSPCIYEESFHFESQDEFLMQIMHKELMSINQQIQIPGFRKGHAPLETVVKMHGAQVIRDALYERSLLELKKNLPKEYFFLNESLLKIKKTSQEESYEIDLAFLAIDEKDLNPVLIEDVIEKWSQLKSSETKTLKNTFYLRFFPEAFSSLKKEELKDEDYLLWHNGQDLKLYEVKYFDFYQKKEDLSEEVKKYFVDFLRLDANKINKDYFINKGDENLYLSSLESYSKATQNLLKESFGEEFLQLYWNDFLEKNKEILKLEDTPFAYLLEKKSLQAIFLPCVHRLLLKTLNLPFPEKETSINYITEPLKEQYAEKYIQELSSI